MGQHASVRAHQIYVVLMLAGSLLWLVLIVAAILPPLVTVTLSLTPHPAVLDQGLIRVAILVGLVLVPLGVGLAGYLVPAEGDRPTGLALARELLRGYLLTPILGGLMLFLPGVGITRKARSIHHGWSDVHIPIVVVRDEPTDS